MGRRGLVSALVLLLGGCGFSPLYAPVAGRAPSSDLAKIFVAVIPDRPGQLLREALQVRLEGAGAPAAKRYTLEVNYGISSEGIGSQPDSSSTFTRIKATANWRLLSATPGAAPLASGVATAEDGYSVIVDQYFYSDLQNGAVDRRFAKTLADQIVLRLAAYFRDRAKVAAR